MKKRITIVSLVVVALGVLAVAPLALSGPGGHRLARQGMGEGHHPFAEGFLMGRLGHIKEELDLTEGQVAQIKAIVGDVKEQNAPYHDQMRGSIHDIARTLIANPNDLAGAQAKLEAQNAAETAMKKNVLSATSKALNVLTPQQRTKLATMLERHADRRKSDR
jgi:periplasmic protein CpxP/Spy